MTRWAWIAMLVAAAGCGGGGGSSATDGGPDAMPACEEAACDDGVYCNGAERCDPDDPAADERACVAGTPPCSGECDEAADRCTDGCVDEDGDGHSDVACGGDDCDDDNPSRFPGNPEVCDDTGVDEDCDPTTLGDDLDGDGYVGDGCCNLQSDGSMRCGADCDDSTMDVNPEVVDVCGNGDEDCDAEVDEDPNQTYYRDRDGDGFGTPEDTIQACSALGSYVALDTDCDDELASRNPDADERCDTGAVDEDCDGSHNEGCDCSPQGASRSCGLTDVGACTYGTQECLADGSGRSAWGECIDDEGPVDELCNLEDDDCDTRVDEDFDCVPGTTETGTNACGRTGERTCLAGSCTWDASDFSRMERSTTCDYCDDTGHGPEQEMGFATETVERSFGREMVTLLGDATESGGNIVLALYSDPEPRVGGAYQPDPIPLGYGGARLDVIEMNSTRPAGATQPPGDGWAAVMVAEAGSGSLLGAGGADLGVPRDRDGIAVEWRRYQEDDPADDTDSLVLRRLSASGADPVLARANPRPEAYTDGTYPRQRLEVFLGPDFPGTTLNETTVVVRFFHNASWVEAFSCGPSGTVCSFTIAAGTPMHFGLSASVGSGREETFFYDAAGGDSDTVPTLEVSGLCP